MAFVPSGIAQALYVGLEVFGQVTTVTVHRAKGTIGRIDLSALLHLRVCELPDLVAGCAESYIATRFGLDALIIDCINDD